MKHETDGELQCCLMMASGGAGEGYSLEYLRVPVTDEKAPKERDFVVLQRRIWDKPPNTALIFNCQMGRGRTSTGMIIGSLLLLRQQTATLPATSQGLPAPHSFNLIPHSTFSTSSWACVPQIPTGVLLHSQQGTFTRDCGI